MVKVAVVLSGCGFEDGSEVHESTLTLLALKQRGIEYQCVAPNLNQARLYDYFSKEYISGTRSVLPEAGKIARSDILDISQCDAADYAAVIFPGGAGAAQTLSNFALDIEHYSVDKNILKFTQEMIKQEKPAGYICISPCLIPGIYQDAVECTIGKDKTTAEKLESLGVVHIECDATSIVVDSKYKVVTTPAYMLADNIEEVYLGISKLVDKIAEFIQ